MSVEPPYSPDSRPATGRAQSILQTFTLVITNLTKLAGAALAVNELGFRSHLRKDALIADLIMMAGGQVGEGVLLGAIDRILGRQTSQPPPPS